MVHKYLFLALISCFVMACGGNEGTGEETGGTEGGLTAAQLENGIGPITSIELTALDAELADKGAAIFTTKCAMCHKFDQRYVGPPLGDLFERRTPEFVMNMMLNPAEMVEKHPEVKEMLAQYLTPMPFQNLTEEDARALLEYMRRETQSTGS